MGFAKCNLSMFKYFVTLTFAPIEEKERHIEKNNNRFPNDYNLKFKYVNDSNNIEECSKELHLFFNKFKIQLNRRGYNLFYLGVPEYQKNGSIHYHFLMSDIPADLLYEVPSWLDINYFKGSEFNNGVGLKSWLYGKSDVELIKNKSRVTSYISKYMLKSFYDLSNSDYLERLNKQRFYKSNNLVKPNELTEAEYDLLSEEIENECIGVYRTEHTNIFTDNTTVKTIYQLNDV